MSENFANAVRSAGPFFYSVAENNGDMSLSISVFLGNVVFNIFRKGVRAPYRYVIPRGMMFMLHEALMQVIEGRQCRKQFRALSKWSRESRKYELMIDIAVERNDGGEIFINVGSVELQSIRFPVAIPSNIDAGESMSVPDRSALAARMLMEQIRFYIPIAAILTSPQRAEPEPGQNMFESSPKGRRAY